ncbi:MAG: DUF1569 domain-containing protein [Acidobacteriota bacterium]
MRSLFDPADRRAILDRLAALSPESPRQWGKMDVAQMMAHCVVPLAIAAGDGPTKQRWIGRLLTPLIRSSVLGEKPFSRNGPTDPDFKIVDRREFATEKERLRAAIEAFAGRGPDYVSHRLHPFFGRLSGAEWGVLMHKHLDHHLRQFAV